MRIQHSRNSNGEVRWDTKKPSTIDINYLSIDISKLSDKRFNYKTLAIMSLYSTSHNGHRFLNRDILFDYAREIEQLSNLKMNTILRSIRKLVVKDDLVNQYRDELGYMYYTITTNQCVRVNKNTLKQLINIGDNNLIKTYLFLVSQCSKFEKKIIPNQLITQSIGLSPASNNSLQTITNATNKLNELGLIQKTRQTFMDNGMLKTFNKYIIK